ncbi:hypothetical protein Misp01_62040 [Microtetraspora sp. NBRC 13810]|uniref:hypothetical protein n=1 Tax=Microtetraspora sp. NBRC 13810 TaxID=3030990 RepID=UPI0024A568BE|nr:hypothetical protein [Microtetraspora sp. NBRC 13810]GLW11076.1 hypothetical protein Misp01_62040 [Microtetraspora sp. NBRC 13810]
MRAPSLALCLLLTACTPAAPAGATRYTASGTVLENERHGPQFCRVVLTSKIPQCDGADIVGWDWAAVRHESGGGVKWGSYTVVGTWDGGRLHLTEPPRPPAPPPSPGAVDHIPPTPCPEPAGGWRPVDPATATFEALSATKKAVSRSPQFAGSWLDNDHTVDFSAHDLKEDHEPVRFVFNLMFTGDLAGNERLARQTWGGALCVSRAEHTHADLDALAKKVYDDARREQHPRGPRRQTGETDRLRRHRRTAARPGHPLRPRQGRGRGRVPACDRVSPPHQEYSYSTWSIRLPSPKSCPRSAPDSVKPLLV